MSDKRPPPVAEEGSAKPRSRAAVKPRPMRRTERHCGKAWDVENAVPYMIITEVLINMANLEFDLGYAAVLKGLTAYQYAVSQGYTGTEEEYAAACEEMGVYGGQYLASVNNAATAAKSANAAALQAAAAAAEVKQQVASPFVIAATAAAMTDHTKAYVYTGSEEGYTHGGWYWWNGSAWALGGTAVDDTLSVPGTPADAAKVGEVIETGNLNQYVKVAPFVTGNGSSGTVHGTRATLEVLEDGTLRVTDSSSANTTYGFYTRLSALGRSGHKILVSFSGVDIDWTNENVRRWYVQFVQNNLTIGSYHFSKKTEDAFIETLTGIDESGTVAVQFLCQQYEAAVGDPYTVGAMQVIDLTEMFGAGYEPTIEDFRSVYPSVYAYRVPAVQNDLRSAKALILSSQHGVDPNAFSCDPEERELYRQDMLACAASYLVNEVNSTCVVGTPSGITDKPFVALYDKTKGYENMYLDSSSNEFVYTDTQEYDGAEYPVVYLDCTAFAGLLTKCIPYAESPMYYAFSHLGNIDYKTMFDLGFNNGSYIDKPYTFDLHQYNSTWTGETAFLANHSGNRLYTLYKSGAVDESVFNRLETGDILYVAYSSSDVTTAYRGIHHIQVFLRSLEELNEYGAAYGVTFKSSEKFAADTVGAHGYVIDVANERDGVDCIRVVSLDSYIAAVSIRAIYMHKANATPFNSIKAAHGTFSVIDHALYL